MLDLSDINFLML